MCSTDLDDGSHEVRNIIQLVFVDVKVVEVSVSRGLSDYLGPVPDRAQ